MSTLRSQISAESTATGVLVEGRAAQAITFGSPPTQTYGMAALKVAASSTSWLTRCG